MNFVTYEEFIRDIKDFITKIPRFETVGYIGRSGMIPAFIYAKHNNLPIIDIEELSGKVDGLIVFDDSVLSGKELNRIQSKFDAVFACVYASGVDSGIKYRLDYIYKVIEPPRLFEWNWTSIPEVKDMAFDMDGVLCRKPTFNENDDGKNYKKFLEITEPKYIPSFEIGAIVTARLEKYRKETEDWLKKHGAKYKELIMLDSTAEKRREKNLHVVHKSNNYINRFYLFVEDEPEQAKQISELTGKPVLCINSWKVYNTHNSI